MLEFFKYFYFKLPVIRELKQIFNFLRELCANQKYYEIRFSKIGQLLHVTQELYMLSLLEDERHSAKKKLSRFEYQVFSQNGEDGIIREIFKRIGTSSRCFLEIGIGDGLENNTTFLLTQGWHGFWIDGNSASCIKIRSVFSKEIATHRLVVLDRLITAENINQLLSDIGVPDEIDLFSLDIDRNTYWVWNGITRLNPRVVVVEYNATYPPGVDWKVDYEPMGIWNGTSFFGASLSSLEFLGKTKGYSLVGCDLTGTNAFFVRSDLCDDHFLEPFDAETHFEPPRYYLQRCNGHPHGLNDSK